LASRMARITPACGGISCASARTRNKTSKTTNKVPVILIPSKVIYFS
jgi:hypothetical protein